MRQSPRLLPPDERDPREGRSAEIIDLATRNVLPQVTQRRPRSEAATLLGGIAVVALLGAVTLWSMNGARQARLAAPAVPAQPRADVPPAVPPQAITVLQPRPGAPQQQPGVAGQPAGQVAPAPALNPANAPAVVFDASAFPAPYAVPGAPVAAASGGPGSDDFAARLGVSGNGAAVATAGISPKTTVTQGTLIPAVLETAIDTDVPGYVRAVVSADVRSFDGSRVLVPRSSRLIGQYKSGMSAGQKRAYVIWTRLIRPDGVSVNIGSPAIAFGGETGIAGKVDTHFFERFGSAMLLSVVGGLSALGTGGASVVIGAGGQSAAAAAVGQTGSIGPTVRIRQGEPIRVFTARDLDFSKVTTE